MFRAVAIFMSMIVSSFAFADAPCRTIDYLRVDSVDAIQTMQDVCEVTGGIGIFTEGINEITFPRLASANLINIEAYSLQAVSFPALRTVGSLHISGPDLTVAEFPRLQSVGNTLWLQTRQMRFINFPNLGSVNFLGIQANPSLEFVFADRLYNVRQSSITNNPSLNEGSQAMLAGATQTLTPEEIAFIDQAKADIQAMRQRLIEQRQSEEPMPPTGHDTYFGGYSQTTYYRWYPYYMWNYWTSLYPWSYQRYYGPIW